MDTLKYKTHGTCSREIDITKVKKPVFDIDYSDFFHIDGNFEYFYENSIV